MKHGHPTLLLQYGISLPLCIAVAFYTEQGNALINAFLTYPAPYVLFGIISLTIAFIVFIPATYAFFVIFFDIPARHGAARIAKKTLGIDKHEKSFDEVIWELLDLYFGVWE